MNVWEKLSVNKNPVFKPDGKRLKIESHGSTYCIWCTDGDCGGNRAVFKLSGCKT